MKAIVTKFVGPTNTKGSKIIASDMDGNQISVPYDDSLNSDKMHDKAAIALCHKMQWGGMLASGSLKNGYVYVFLTHIHGEIIMDDILKVGGQGE
jgi:hypothetical protein